MKSFFLLLVVIIAIQSAVAVVTYNADSANIRYSGRTALSGKDNTSVVKFDWSGVEISTVVKNTKTVKAYLSQAYSEGNMFNVIIDGVFVKFFNISGSVKKAYTLATDLTTTQSHTILLTKRTEASFSIVSFYAFEVDDGGSLTPPAPASPRRIEFIGDSITCGYGNEGDSPNCPFSALTQNNYLAYGSIVAREVYAEHHTEAWSGRGLIRNYGDKSNISTIPFPAYYTRLYANDVKTNWTFSKWVPHAVVINLGTNDFSTDPKPNKNYWVNAYRSFVSQITAFYSSNPKLVFFLVCGPMASNCGYVNETVTSLANYERKVYYVPLSGVTKFPDDFGCDYHPNLSGHRKMATKTTAIIADKMGWTEPPATSSTSAATTGNTGTSVNTADTANTEDPNNTDTNSVPDEIDTSTASLVVKSVTLLLLSVAYFF